MQARGSHALAARDGLAGRGLHMEEAIPYQTDLAVSLPYEGSLPTLILQRAGVRGLGHRQRVRGLLGYHGLQRGLVRSGVVLLVLEMAARTEVSATDVDRQMSIREWVDFLLKSRQTHAPWSSVRALLPTGGPSARAARGRRTLAKQHSRESQVAPQRAG